MGGDHAPAEIIRGAVDATREIPHSIVLVGQEAVIRQELSKYKDTGSIDIVHAPETILMDEAPTTVLRQKRDASVNVAVQLVKNHKADAVISAGNTGALMASALFGLGRIEGVDRPAIATVFPTMAGSHVLILDMGANVDCKPRNLTQFGIMGSLYASTVMGVKNPKVGLLSIGGEEGKGNELTVESYALLKQSKINFIGNVEGGDILAGKAHVVVCDGFVGNVILKFAESASLTVIKFLKDELVRHPVSMFGGLLMVPALKGLRKKVDYDAFGGAQLLGVNGVCIKAHGRAKAPAILSAIHLATRAVKEDMISAMSKQV